MKTFFQAHAVKAHAVAGVLATLLIAGFQAATFYVEANGVHHDIAMVKSAIVKLLFLLVPLMAAAGAGGAIAMSANISPYAIKKKKRMKPVFINGVFILIPATIALDHLAQNGHFGTIFYAIQAVELMAGAVNLTLLALNLRDGMSANKASVQSGSRSWLKGRFFAIGPKNNRYPVVA